MWTEPLNVLTPPTENESLQQQLNERVQVAYGEDGAALDTCWQRYQAAVATIGNPADQIKRFESAGIILQPKQLEFCYAARLCDTLGGIEELGFGGAKAGGKSFAVFVQIAIDDCQRFAGLKVLYLREVGKRAQEQLTDLITATLKYVPHTAKQGQISFPNGSKIIVGHFSNDAEATNYAGIEYDIVVIEEATALSLAAYKALRLSARSSKGFRPRTYNTTNPLGKGHAWYKRRFILGVVDEDDESKKLFIPATVYNNRFVNIEYINSLRDLDGVLKAAYLEGSWDVQAGMYFTNWRKDKHVLPALPIGEKLVLPKDWRVWASMDYGLHHWNTVYFHYRTGDGITVTFHELAHRLQYPAEIADDVIAALAIYGLQLKHLAVFYAGSDVFAQTGHSKRSIHQQYQDKGIMLSPANTGPGSRAARSMKLKQLLSTDTIPATWFCTENCSKLIETIPTLLHDKNNMEAVEKVDCDDKGNGGDDSFDGLTYGLYEPARGMIG